MRLATAHPFRVAAIAALLIGTATTVAADPPKPRQVARCREASFTNVALPTSASVDEIRVIVANHSPKSGAAKISVGAGRHDRVVRVLGGASRGLKFTSPLVGRLFRIELDPVFEAPRSACVERVMLYRGGTLVASVIP